MLMIQSIAHYTMFAQMTSIALLTQAALSILVVLVIVTTLIRSCTVRVSGGVGVLLPSF